MAVEGPTGEFDALQGHVRKCDHTTRQGGTSDVLLVATILNIHNRHKKTSGVRRYKIEETAPHPFISLAHSED